jgi:hypothetical protein
MSKVSEVFGINRAQLEWYRDLALGTIASIAGLWAVFALGFESSEFDSRLGLICVLVSAVCCSASPNRLVLFGMTVGVISIQGWLSFSFSRDSRMFVVAIVATLILAGIVMVFKGNQESKKKR